MTTPARTHWLLGSHCLGGDVDRRYKKSRPAQAPVSNPWRCGFHAYLKALMELPDCVPDHDWLQAEQSLAAWHRSFVPPELRSTRLADLPVLCTAQPAGTNQPLRQLANDPVVLCGHRPSSNGNFI